MRIFRALRTRRHDTKVKLKSEDEYELQRAFLIWWVEVLRRGDPLYTLTEVHDRADYCEVRHEFTLRGAHRSFSATGTSLTKGQMRGLLRKNTDARIAYRITGVYRDGLGRSVGQATHPVYTSEALQATVSDPISHLP